MIQVRQTREADPYQFEVTIREDRSETHHVVSLSALDHRRLSRTEHAPERCVEAAFRFLLDREPKESILARFDVSVISRYFPEFESELPEYLAEPPRR
jgi:hypothetical protein